MLAVFLGQWYAVNVMYYLRKIYVWVVPECDSIYIDNYWYFKWWEWRRTGSGKFVSVLHLCPMSVIISACHLLSFRLTYCDAPHGTCTYFLWRSMSYVRCRIIIRYRLGTVRLFDFDIVHVCNSRNISQAAAIDHYLDVSASWDQTERKYHWLHGTYLIYSFWAAMWAYLSIKRNSYVPVMTQINRAVIKKNGTCH